MRLVTLMTTSTMITLAACLAAAPAALAQVATVPCQTCHEEPADWEARKTFHAPAAAGECLTCHSPHASSHGKLMREDAARLCLGCHEDLAGKSRGEGAHSAVTAERSCLSCHDPHAADRSALLLEAVPALCVSCHQSIPTPQDSAHPHAPASAGECLTCHDPHGSEHAALAVEAQPGLCAGCHDTADASVRAAHQGIPAASSTCVSCHAPHGSPLEKLIRLNTHAPFADGTCEVCHQDPAAPASAMRAGVKDLCLGCHEPRQAGHPTDAEESCISCHTPHTTSGAALIAGSEQDVCIACHEEIGVRQASAETTHPEQEKGQHCSVCHELHTGQTRFYLKQSNPLAMCSQCHQSHSEFAHPMGRGVLDRSRRGRTVDCLSCHDPHGTTYPGMLVADPRRELCIRCHTDSMMGLGK